MKLTALICAFAISGAAPSLMPGHVAYAAPAATVAEPASQTPQPPKTEALEPAGAAYGTTIRQARIAQNWLVLVLAAAILAAIVFGLASDDNETTTTTPTTP